MKRFLKKYLFLIFAIPLILIVTYLWFTSRGIFPTGVNLGKNDWLSFWGSFLSFSGSVILGAIAVWQNKQANDVNEKAIAENRRISEIQFEHDLKKNEYTLIINGIQEIHGRIFDICQTFNSTLKETPQTIDDAFLDSVIRDITLVRCMLIDSILPPCYDDKYPILKDEKDNIKQILEQSEKSLQTIIKNHDYNITLNIPQGEFIRLSSYFHNMLNDVQSYSSFTDDEGNRSIKPTT